MKLKILIIGEPGTGKTRIGINILRYLHQEHGLYGEMYEGILNATEEYQAKLDCCCIATTERALRKRGLTRILNPINKKSMKLLPK